MLATFLLSIINIIGIKNMSKEIDSILYVKATGKLELEVEKELETPDPEKAKAMRILQKEEDEDTRRDD